MFDKCSKIFDQLHDACGYFASMIYYSKCFKFIYSKNGARFVVIKSRGAFSPTIASSSLTMGCSMETPAKCAEFIPIIPKSAFPLYVLCFCTLPQNWKRTFHEEGF